MNGSPAERRYSSEASMGRSSTSRATITTLQSASSLRRLPTYRHQGSRPRMLHHLTGSHSSSATQLDIYLEQLVAWFQPRLLQSQSKGTRHSDRWCRRQTVPTHVACFVARIATPTRRPTRRKHRFTVAPLQWRRQLLPRRRLGQCPWEPGDLPVSNRRPVPLTWRVSATKAIRCVDLRPVPIVSGRGASGSTAS